MKLLGAVILTITAFSVSAAEKLEMDINLYLNNKLIESKVLQTATEQMQTVTADKFFKFKVTPTLNTDIITLTSTLHTYISGEYELFQEPKLLVKLNEMATIEIGRQNDKVYKVEITTRKI